MKRLKAALKKFFDVEKGEGEVVPGCLPARHAWPPHANRVWMGVGPRLAMCVQSWNRREVCETLQTRTFNKKRVKILKLQKY